MSTAMLRASFPKGAKELSVSLLQALVLLLFNDADELSYEAIKEELGVKDDKELQRTLLSLSAGKVRGAAFLQELLGLAAAVVTLGLLCVLPAAARVHCTALPLLQLHSCIGCAAVSVLPHQVRVLLKSPKGPEVARTDVFSYNAAFSNPLFRIKVNNIQMKETQEENAKTNAEVSIMNCRSAACSLSTMFFAVVHSVYLERVVAAGLADCVWLLAMSYELCSSRITALQRCRMLHVDTSHLHSTSLVPLSPLLLPASIITHV
jgi:hypothetical protein